MAESTRVPRTESALNELPYSFTQVDWRFLRSDARVVFDIYAARRRRYSDLEIGGIASSFFSPNSKLLSTFLSSRVSACLPAFGRTTSLLN